MGAPNTMQKKTQKRNAEEKGTAKISWERAIIVIYIYRLFIYVYICLLYDINYIYMYIVWYFNVYFMVFSYEGGAISPTSRAKSFNSSHRSNFCTSRILWKPWRCWRGSWVKAKARELATCGLSAFGRKPPGSRPMPLPCFIVLRNSFWAWCWARQCAIWQLCVRRPNLGTLALQELQNSILVKSLYRKMELWGAAVDEASFNTAFRTMQDWAGRLAFSSVEPCHLSPVEHVALRPWGCPRFSTTNLIGVKKVFLRCNLRMRSWLRWNTSSCLTSGQNFLQAFCGRMSWTLRLRTVTSTGIGLGVVWCLG